MPAWTDLVSQEFAEVDLGDERLERRCQQLVSQLWAQPDKSLPQACGNWADTKAAYRFFSNERVTREKLLEPHVAQTILRCSREEAILAIQDTTSFTMGVRHSEGLGPVGYIDEVRGFLAHSALAVCATDGEILGVLHQEVWARGKKKPKNERPRTVRRRPRESERWVRGIEGVSQLSIQTKLVHVFDREGDVYEAIELLERTGQRFVIRASSNRRLNGGQGYLLDNIRKTPKLGSMKIEVAARDGHEARAAVLDIRATTSRIRPPLELKSPGREIEVGIIHLVESKPGPGCEALEWFLLTSEAHATVEECAQVAGYYTKRWKIEEFHMALKTGCRLEDRQLQRRERLEAFLGMADVIAILLLRLRDLARRDADALAHTMLNPIQISLLTKKYHKLDEQPTVRAALRAVAQLGGFLGRRGDGEPGWRTIWRGAQSLLLMEYGCIVAAGVA